MTTLYFSNSPQVPKFSIGRAFIEVATAGIITELFTRFISKDLVNYALDQPEELGINIRQYDFGSSLKMAVAYTTSLSIAGLVMRAVNMTFQFNSIALYATCAIATAVSILALARFCIKRTASVEDPPAATPPPLSTDLYNAVSEFQREPAVERKICYPSFILFINPNLRKFKGDSWCKIPPARLLFFFNSDENKIQAGDWEKQNREHLGSLAHFSPTRPQENIMVTSLNDSNYSAMKRREINDILQ